MSTAPKSPWVKGAASGEQPLPAPAEVAAVSAPSAPPIDPPSDPPSIADIVAKSKEEAATVKLVKMYRDTPMHPGGPTTAEVHPNDVGLWAVQDWKLPAE